MPQTKQSKPTKEEDTTAALVAQGSRTAHCALQWEGEEGVLTDSHFMILTRLPEVDTLASAEAHTGNREKSLEHWYTGPIQLMEHSQPPQGTQETPSQQQHQHPHPSVSTRCGRPS